jgi:hypothetical protein
MGSTFLVYLRLGFEHIADVNGYDHLLFLAALCAVYTVSAWKQVLWLVTAFTAGHTLTLALATLGLIPVNTAWVEFLIPVTILATAVLNIVGRSVPSDRTRPVKYGLTLGFGLVHGLGFSSFLRTLLGSEESIVFPLLAFNLGLELGQMAILAVLLFLAALVTRWLDLREWNLVLSGAAAGVALTMILERWPF